MFSKLLFEEFRFIQPSGILRSLRLITVLIFGFIFATGCAHNTANRAIDQYSPGKGYRLMNMGVPGNSDSLFLVLTFSGGGTRAASLSYGLLEELARTEIIIDGRKRRLLDEVDLISGVSGGSFTAAYYGLFGDRIFDDFEKKFLKKNIQRGLLARALLYPPNWFRLFSSYYGTSDMAAEYYDKYVFDGGTFGDIAARGGPAIFVLSTDMTEGTTFPFNQEMFDVICSDVSAFKVAKATAASSAVPIALSPIILRNHAGTCGYTPEWVDEVLKEHQVTTRRFHQAMHVKPYLEPDRKRYIHLVDGGVADNLGLRLTIDRITQMGDAWSSLKYVGLEKTRKIVFIAVNAETAVDTSQDMKGSSLPFTRILKSITSTPMSKYNFETLELVRSSFPRWADEISKGRCSDENYNHDKGSCGDIEFYLAEVAFHSIPDESERRWFQALPTSFKLPDETVDKLKDIAGRLLRESSEFQQLLGDLK